MEFYYADGDDRKGPVPLQDLPQYGLQPGTLVWREGMPGWARADSVPELRGVLAVSPEAVSYTSRPAAAEPFPNSPQAPVAPYLPYAENAAPPAGYGGAAAWPDPAAQIMPTPYPGAQPLAYGGYVGQPPAGGLAVTSLVLGIASFPLSFIYCAGVPCAILAVVFGHTARARARRGEAGGGGMALAGLICGYAVLGFAAVVMLWVVAFFGFAKGR